VVKGIPQRQTPMKQWRKVARPQTGTNPRSVKGTDGAKGGSESKSIALDNIIQARKKARAKGRVVNAGKRTVRGDEERLFKNPVCVASHKNQTSDNGRLGGFKNKEGDRGGEPYKRGKIVVQRKGETGV